MIDATYFFTNTLLLIAGTLMIRGSFIALAGRMKLTPEIKELFTFIPAAILPALFMPATFYHQGTVEALLNRERFVVLVIAFVATYFVRNTLFCVALGLSLLYGATFLS